MLISIFNNLLDNFELFCQPSSQLLLGHPSLYLAMWLGESLCEGKKMSQLCNFLIALFAYIIVFNQWFLQGSVLKQLAHFLRFSQN